MIERTPCCIPFCPRTKKPNDEFAEWMMTEEYADDVSNIVGRLGVKARAAGISLVFAAQRPDALVSDGRNALAGAIVGVPA